MKTVVNYNLLRKIEKFVNIKSKVEIISSSAYKIPYPYCIVEVVWQYHKLFFSRKGIEEKKPPAYNWECYSVYMINNLFKLADLTDVDVEVLRDKYRYNYPDGYEITENVIKKLTNKYQNIYMSIVKLEEAIKTQFKLGDNNEKS